MAKEDSQKAARGEMIWENLGMVAISISFVAALGCIFGAAFLMTIAFFTRMNTPTQVPVPEKVEREERRDIEAKDDVRSGLRIVPAIYTQYGDDEPF